MSSRKLQRDLLDIVLDTLRIIALFILAMVIAWNTKTLLKYLYDSLQSLNPEISVAVFTGITTLTVLTLVNLISRFFDSNKFSSENIYHKKMIKYEELVSALYKVIKKNNFDKKLQALRLLDKDWMKTALLWIPDNVLLDWNDMILSLDSLNSCMIDNEIIQIIKVIRSDIKLGNRNLSKIIIQKKGKKHEER